MNPHLVNSSESLFNQYQVAFLLPPVIDYLTGYIGWIGKYTLTLIKVWRLQIESCQYIS